MREDYVVIKETKRRRVAAALISLDPAETRGLVQKCSRRIRAIVSTISIPDHLLRSKAGSATDQPVGGNFGL
jgi:hypothetical protein